ncbi:MAG: PTS sugar transporter subunit IIC, partial [Fusobacterium mortiferum]
MREFLKRKGVELSIKKYLVDASSYMALGLFSTLLIGTILNTIGEKLEIAFLTDVVWKVARDMTGPGIGLAVAYGLKAPHLVLFSSTVTGAIGAM